MSTTNVTWKTIEFACGHRRRVRLSAAAAEEVQEQTLVILSGSRCAACHIEQRRLFARRLNAVFGLRPIEGDPGQVDLAEDVRAHVLQILAPSRSGMSGGQDTQALAQLIATLNRRVDAGFWIKHRMVIWEKHVRSSVTALMDLLQVEG